MSDRTETASSEGTIDPKAALYEGMIDPETDKTNPPDKTDTALTSVTVTESSNSELPLTSSSDVLNAIEITTDTTTAEKTPVATIEGTTSVATTVGATSVLTTAETMLVPTTGATTSVASTAETTSIATTGATSVASTAGTTTTGTISAGATTTTVTTWVAATTGTTPAATTMAATTSGSSGRIINKRLSGEELTQNWEDLGLHRCRNCKFTTDQEELFKNHTTMCSTPKSHGTVTFSCADNVFKCHACDGTTWKNQTEFEEHIVIHIQENPYVCLSCRNDFPSRRLIELHAKVDHPDGMARSGLRGMKRGRKCIQDLLQKGIIKIEGKLHVPKTPHNQSSVVNKGVDAAVVDGNIKLDPPVTTAVSQENTLTPSVDTVGESSASDSVETTRPMPPPRYSPNQPNTREQATPKHSPNQPNIGEQPRIEIRPILTSKSGTLMTVTPQEQAKQAHLDSLFGELNTANNTLQPTYVSQKIKNIANPTGTVHHIPVNTRTVSDSMSHVVTGSVTSLVNSTYTTCAPKVITTMSTIPPNVVAPVAPKNIVFVPIASSTVMPGLTTGQTSIPLNSILVPSTTSQSMHIPLQGAQLVLPGNQMVVSGPINPSPSATIVGVNTVQSVQSSAGVRPSAGVRSMITGVSQVVQSIAPRPQVVQPIAPRLQVAQPIAPRPTAGTITLVTGVPQVSKPPPTYTDAVSNLTALQNLADLVCPAKQTTQTVTEATKLLHLQASQFVNIPPVALSPSVAVSSPYVLVTENETDKEKSSLKRGNKFLFKVNTSGDLVCEACKKYTKNEQIFRKHVWDHFHNITAVACKKCTLENIQYKEVNQCVLVKDIVASLAKQSRNTAEHIPVSKADVSEVIDITDDDDDVRSDKKGDSQNATEVIVLDDDDEDNESNGGLQIKIASAFSITPNTDFEQMSKDGVNSIEGVTEGLREAVNSSKNSAVASDKLSEKSPAKPQYDSIRRMLQSGNVPKNSTVASDKPPYDYMRSLLQSDTRPNEKVVMTVEDQERIQVNIEGPDDDDNEVTGRELLEKSLSEPGADSESIVSEMLETNLKEFDPTKRVVVPIGNIIQNKFSRRASEQNNSSSNTSEQNNSSSNANAQNNNKETSTLHKMQSLTMGEVRPTKGTGLSSVGRRDTVVNLPKQSPWAFYVCGYEGCKFTCFLSSEYKEHLQSPVHAKEYNYACGHCGQKDYSEDTHVRHVFTHASTRSFILYKCPIRQCKYKSNLRHLYIIHLRAHPSKDLLIKCNYCNKTFPKLEDLEQHLKQNLLKFIVCPHCSFKFGDRMVVMKHMRAEHPERLRFLTVTSQIVCNEREINFYVPPQSKITDVVEPEADSLPSENIDIPSLLENINDKEDKGNKAIGGPIPGNIASDNEDALSLPEEDQSEINRIGDQLKDRRLEKSKGKPTANVKSGPKYLICPKCTYLSYNQARYSQHLSLHDKEPNRRKRFICNLCPLSADGLPSFRTHVSNHVGRNEIKVLNCMSCSYCSNQKCHIMDHVRDGHTPPSQYVLNVEVIESEHFECKYCEFKSRTAEHVHTHEGVVHRVDNTASVKSNCDKDIGSTDQLEAATEQSAVREQATVSELQPTVGESDAPKKKLKYHCEYCNQFFKHKANLKEHLSYEHTDIENKQFIFFKCKYCAYTSTMKERIINHLEKEHNDLELRIMRKIETVESKTPSGGKADAKKAAPAVKEASNVEKNVEHSKPEEKKKDETEIVIPDGNTFKQPFKCPKCDFSANTRLKTMIHLKNHPELKPVRPDQTKPPSKKTARKTTSTSSLVSPGNGTKRHGALTQNIPVLDSSSKNPFTAVKQSVMSSEPGVTDSPNDVSNPPPDHYTLGEQNLHSALSACFIPSEQNMNFQCRICKQKIFKKFVLHRHILNHLNIVFFRCRFCDEGSIERTLMVGHIQKCHPQLPIMYSSVDKTELESTFKEKIFNQNFNDIVDLQTESVPIDRGVKKTSRFDIVKKQVLEYQTIEDSDDENDEQIPDIDSEKDLTEEINDSEKEKPGVKEKRKLMVTKQDKGPYKCPHCRHVARNIYFLNRHMDSHKDPAKIFTCSVCDYRSKRYDVLKHIYNVYHATQPVVVQDSDKVTESQSKDREDSPVSVDSLVSVSGDTSKTVAEDSVPSSADQNRKSSETQELITKKGSNCYPYKLKTVFKCKECGEKRESQTSIYEHFKTSKCNKPMYKCSLCSFMNKSKTVINSHARKRHNGKKFNAVLMPIKSKFRTVKFPVRQLGFVTKKLNHQSSVSDVSSEPSSGSVSPATVASEEEDTHLRCQLCSKYVCESVMKLQFHVNTSHQGVKLKCSICSYKTPLVQHMLNHCRNVHLQKTALYGTENSPAVSKVSKETDSKVAKETDTAQASDASSNNVEYKCPKCSMIFAQLVCVRNHLPIHFKYKPFRCPYCAFNSPRSGNVKSHCEKFHPNKPAKVIKRKNPAIEAKLLKLFEVVKQSVSKQKISLGLSRPAKLNSYELVEEGIRCHGDKFYCDVCNFSAVWKYQVRNHLARIHRKRPLENSDAETPPLKHRKIVNDDRADSESKASVEDISKAPLKYKVIKTQGVKKLQCLECDYQTENIKYMRQHKRRAHEAKIIEQKREVVENFTYRCFYCGYCTIHTSNDIRKHSQTHHPSKPYKVLNKYGVLLSGNKNDSESSASPARPRLSNSPVRSSMSNSPARSSVSGSPSRSLVSNSPARSLIDSSKDSSPRSSKQMSGSTKFCCNLCEYTTKAMFHFRLHLLGHDEFTEVTTELDKEIELACGYCSYTGNNVLDLNAHIATHMGEMRFKCVYCDYCQFHCAKVLSHMKYAHCDEPELVVDRLKKRFTTGGLKLVNFSPVLKLGRIKTPPLNGGRKKYRRIVVETSDSSDDSDDESGGTVILSNKSKAPRYEPYESEDELPKVKKKPTSLKIKTSRAAFLCKTMQVKVQSEQHSDASSNKPSTSDNSDVSNEGRNIVANATKTDGQLTDQQTDRFDMQTDTSTSESETYDSIECRKPPPTDIIVAEQDVDKMSKYVKGDICPEKRTESPVQVELRESSDKVLMELDDVLKQCNESLGDNLKTESEIDKYVSKTSMDVEPATQVYNDVDPITKVDNDFEPATQVYNAVEPVTQMDEDVGPATQVYNDIDPVTEVDNEVEPHSQIENVVEPATQVYNDETQPFDVEDVAKCYDEISNDSDQADDLLSDITAETSSQSKHADINVSEICVGTNVTKHGDMNVDSPDNSGKGLDKLSTECRLECAGPDSDQSEVQSDMNVFEKFSCNFDANSDENKLTEGHEEDSDQDSEANIFEKFNQNQTEESDSPDVTKNTNIEDQESEENSSNIFDKFEYSGKESSEIEKESEKESEVYEEENIFDKFRVSGSRTEAETEVENVGDKTEHTVVEKVTACRSETETFEDMEVDELITSIEETVNQSMQDNSKTEGTSKMDTG